MHSNLYVSVVFEKTNHVCKQKKTVLRIAEGNAQQNSIRSCNIVREWLGPDYNEVVSLIRGD